MKILFSIIEDGHNSVDSVHSEPPRPYYYSCYWSFFRGRYGRDRMVDGSTTQLHIQSVPITTDVLSSYFDQDEVYKIM